jgi:hypothetical protein
MTFFDDWNSPGRDFVSVYGWQAITEDQTPLAEMAKGMFESSLYGEAG